MAESDSSFAHSDSFCVSVGCSLEHCVRERRENKSEVCVCVCVCVREREIKG